MFTLPGIVARSVGRAWAGAALMMLGLATATVPVVWTASGEE